MKKIIFLSLFAFFACKSTTTIERSNRFIPNNLGKCYTNVSTKQKTKGGFLLKVIDNQYSTVKDSIHIDSLDFGNNAEVIRMVIKESALKYVFKKKIEQYCTTEKFDKDSDVKAHCTVCLIEDYPHYQAIIKTDIDSLRKNKQLFYHFKKQILTDTSYILRKNYRHKPLFLKKNEFYFQNSTWSGYYEISCSRGCGGFRIKDIEMALQKQSYKVKFDDKFSKKEWRQLRRFQRNNGLKVGQLTIETLKKLGVQY